MEFRRASGRQGIAGPAASDRREGDRRAAAALLAVAVVLAASLAPSPVAAQWRGGIHRQDAARDDFADRQQRIMPLRLPEAPFPWGFRSSAPRHHVHRRRFAPAATFVAPLSVVVVAPAASEAVTSVVYDPAPVAAPVAPVATAAVLPTPTLVDFPTGWYQLRGDGVTAPYQWVWIPKPPAALAPAVVEAPPPTAAPSVAPRPRETATSPAYHWTDGGGVTTWTNRLDRVPKRFREQAAASTD